MRSTIIYNYKLNIILDIDFLNPVNCIQINQIIKILLLFFWFHLYNVTNQNKFIGLNIIIKHFTNQKFDKT